MMMMMMMMMMMIIIITTNHLMYSSPRANVIHIRPKSQRYNTAAPQPAHF